MKVVGGAYKGRNVSYPRGAVNLRPTSALVRKAIFDIIGSIPEGLGEVEGTDVVDMYAGTGMLGIEAISRGAASVTFVESNLRAVAGIKRNLDNLGVPAGRYRVVHSDVERFLGGRSLGSNSTFDIAFIDAPYNLAYSASDGSNDKERMPIIGGNLLNKLPASLVVIETMPGEYTIPSEWDVIKQRRYGGTMVTILHGRQQGQLAT